MMDLLPVLAPVVAGLAGAFLFGVLGRKYLKADDDFWERIRDRVWPALHSLLKPIGGYALNEADARSYAATVDMSPEELEHVLSRAGFYRNPMAGYKTSPEGVDEVGSWALRESPKAERQLHVTLFPRDDGRTDVHAHEEPSSINPDTAVEHVRGPGMDVATGVERTRSILRREDVSYELIENRYSE